MSHDTVAGNVEGYKVTDRLRQRLVGVACSSLEELKIKGCKKLQVSSRVSLKPLCIFSYDDDACRTDRAQS